MEAPTKVFGPARIVALALIGVVALGLAYLQFKPAGDPVSVPSGARAGQLQLHSCRYATANGSYAADCGTLVVRENRHNADSRLIALPVTRIRARTASSSVPIFRLQGGPGITNMSFEDASRFADKRDVVLVGYRGIDGSSRLDCREVVSARKHSPDLLSEKSLQADSAAFKACANRLQDDGVDLGGYTLPERADDLDAARRALGYQRIDLLSESAGTRTAMIYAWRYAKRVHRSVMIGANPPGHFLWDAKTTGEQIRRYAALCADDASCQSRTSDLAASIHSTDQNLPDRFWFLPIKKGNVKVGAFFGLMNATPDAGPLSGPLTIDTLLAAGKGDGSGAWLLSLMAQLVFPDVQVWGDVASVGRSDAAHARGFFTTHADRGSVIGSPATDFIWGDGRLIDSWPANPDENRYTRVQDSSVETLLIGGNLDVATPPQWATRELLPHLPNGRQVVLKNLGHTDDLWAYEPAASSHLINTYFDSGRVDTSLYTHASVDFTPSFSQGALAKIIVAVMLTLAALALLSLLWLPLRLRRRGAFGTKSSGALRSLYAVLLGLGGWFVGALIVLTAWPTLPLDDEVLALVSVGIPVGLGIYWASARPADPERSRIARFVATAVGAIIGAWLGYNVSSGLFALVTAILGAVAGANLIVLGLDVWRDRAAREPAEAVADAMPALEA
jgi:pimeloyl-ACP methyl ester carboxylesterase